MSAEITAPDRQQATPTAGKGNTTVATSSAPLGAYLQVQERIARTFADPSYEPPRLPVVALELLELSRRPEVEVRDVVSLLEKDPVLASRLLRHVRSPLYAGGAEIRSLQKALMHLGLEHIRDIALELTVGARVFRAEHYAEAMDRVSRHSRLTAYLTQVVCRHALYDASHAFLCGLLHDVGLAAGLIALGDVPRSEERPNIEVALPVLLEMHVELGAQVAESWQLSPEVVNVIRHHHELSDADGKVQRLAAVVCLAEHLADELGIGDESISRADANPPLAATREPRAADAQPLPPQIVLACETLGLDERKMALIRAEAAKLILNLEGPKSATENHSEAGVSTATATPPRSAISPEAHPGSGPAPAKTRAPSGFWGRLLGLLGLG